MNRFFPGTFDSIESVVEYIQTFFEKEKVHKKSEEEYLLLLRDSISILMVHADERDPAPLNVSVNRFGNSVRIRLSEIGDTFDFQEGDMLEARHLKNLGVDGEDSAVLASLLSGKLEKRYRYKRLGQKNIIILDVPVKGEISQLKKTFGALILAVVLGVLLGRFAPQAFNAGLSSALLDPIKTMFLNALKIIIAPVVFFSLVTCVSQFTDFGELGKLGGKILLLFVVTSFLAIAIAFAVFFVMQPGDFGSVIAENPEVAEADNSISIKQIIVDIVPSNYLRPFIESDMLQLIFLAIITGIASGMIGKYSSLVKKIFEALNELFLRITMMILKFIPLAVFASILNLVLNTGYDALLDLVNFFGCFFVSVGLLLVLYMLVVLLIGHLNPFTFLRKYFPTMILALSLNSSSAMMPHNMKVCKEGFGVSEKVYSLSIPLGATLNMAGGATYLVIATLFLARLYGVEIPSSLYLPMAFSIFVLAAGAPGVAGSAFICLAVLLSQLNIPAEALGILMGIDAIVSMFRTAFNTTGDVAVTITVASNEGKLDLATYNS